MSEGVPHDRVEEEQDLLSIALSFAERAEVFPFPGIRAEILQRMQEQEAEEAQYDLPYDITPIAERIRRFEDHGMKVVLGKNPNSGNIFILPGDSSDIEQDGLLVGTLNIEPTMPEQLQTLIERSRRDK